MSENKFQQKTSEDFKKLKQKLNKNKFTKNTKLNKEMN